jgi:hypothetical protein
MSLLLHKKIHKRHRLWLKFFSLFFVLHCILLWCIFINDMHSLNTIAISLNKHIDYSAPILFVPLTQTVTTQENTASALTNTNQPKQTTLAQTKINVPEKKATPATTIKQSPQQTQKIVPVPTSKLEKKEEKIVAPETPKVVEPSNSEKPAAPTEKKSTTAQMTSPPSTQQASTAPQQRVVPKNAHVSHDYKEVEMLRRTALLQKELIAAWKPPTGMPSDAHCEISLSVGDNGIIKSSTIIKSSGIFIYDLSARHALGTMKMPQWTYNKTITITFRQ